MKAWLNRNLVWLGLIGFFVYVGIGIWIHTEKKAAQSVILKPTPTPPGPKRYVLWNNKQFERKPGVQSLSVNMLSAMGAKNIKQLELINGVTFEGEIDETKIKAFAQTDWVLQEEIEHHILMGQAPPAKCHKSAGPLVEIACPGEPLPNPGPEPSPQPGPSPNPVEPDRSWGRARVHAKEAQALVDTSQVKIGIVDTGLDTTHPCNGHIIATRSFTGEPVSPDPAGHGTHVTGTVNGKCGVGIAPKAGVVFGKGLRNSGSGSSSELGNAVAWVCPQVQAASFSWGSAQSDNFINQSIKTFCTDRGVYVFVAAGNDSGPVNWPAKLAGSNPLVFAIAASDQQDRITNFSSRGPEIRFISPGAKITSNWPGGGTRDLDGTSMATPHTAAICAFGISRGRRPCINAVGTVSGYPFADALATAQ